MIARTLRVGLVSGVRHALPYLQILRHDPRVEIVGVFEESNVPDWMLDEGRAAAEAVGVPWTVGLGKWLLPEQMDLAIVCSEPTRHARLAIAGMDAGLDVLVDKPVATTVVDADRVVAAMERTGRQCSVVNRTHAPALRRARRWIDAGWLGLPLHLDMEFLASGAFFATSVERPELVVDESLSGGGEMLNFLGYCVDAIHFLTGLKVTSVYAMSGALFSSVHEQHGVEDTAVISLGLQNGVSATVTVGRIPFAPGLGPTSSSLRVLGSHGHAVVDDDRPALQRYGRTNAAESFDGGQAALEAYLDHVVTQTLAGENVDYNVTHARTSVAVIEAAYRSHTSGSPQQPS